MSLRVGHLKYLNTLPLYAHLAQHTTATLVPGCPSDLNAALSAGTLDVSLVSSWAYLQNRDTWDLLPGYCVSTKQPIGSVNLYHRLPLAALDNQPVALTPQSATSAQLLRLFCKTFWHIAPRFTPLPSLASAHNYPAFLLIGDDALRRQYIDGYQTLDLASLWHEKTHLPMTFAVLAARRPAPGILDELEASLAWAEAHPRAIVERAAAQSGLPTATLQNYFNRLDYRLDQPQQDGLRAFASLCGCPIHETAP